jgi:xanthine dehydrogenase FAD-binding subunit
MMEVLFPRTLKELWAMFAAFSGGRILAGGTDLLAGMRKTGDKPPAVFCLEGLTELQGIEMVDGEMFIGAGVTLQRLLDCAALKQDFPALWQALSVLGSPPVRHSATLGGNICTASPAGDTLPPLYVFGAGVEISSEKEQRRLSINDFILGPGRTALRPGEIVTRIIIPGLPPGALSTYDKVGKRRALAIAVASLASLILLNGQGIVTHIRLAWGSVGPTIVSLPAIEEFLRGKSLSPELLKQAGDMAAQLVTPIDDVRASAAYRRQLAGNLLLRLSGQRVDYTPAAGRRTGDE